MDRHEQTRPMMFRGDLDYGEDDELFDDQLPRRMRAKAPVYFTPVEVARVAARLLAPRRGMRVLDVGSGAGKFSIVAAHMVPGSTFFGVEHRSHLVDVANDLAARARVTNVHFIHADAMAIDWTPYDAFYLFNPFAEFLHERSLAFDGTVDLEPTRFHTCVADTRQRLSAAPLGTRVVTYHGFGAPIPLGYDIVETHPSGSDHLDLLVKTRDITPITAGVGFA